MAKQRTLTRTRCLPARSWSSGPAPRLRSTSGIRPSPHCGALGWPAAIPSPSQSPQGYALPKEVKDSEVVGFHWPKGRAQGEHVRRVPPHSAVTPRADNRLSHRTPGPASTLGADPLRQLPEPDFRIQSPQKDEGISNFLNGRRVSEVLEDS